MNLGASLMNAIGIRIVWIGFILLVLVVLYFQLKNLGVLEKVMDSEQLRIWVVDLGYSGPLLIVFLMALAIVVNPIPSAPIALAAGAAYGHAWGTVYVIVGATLGAVAAFSIARLLGYEIICRLLRREPNLGWAGSQNTLTTAVLISRLIPFLSFDLVSYGAGLTPLKFWRFVLATFLGLVPASFLLAHFGGELSSANLEKALTVVMLLGLMTLLPVLVVAMLKRHKLGRPTE